jgi:hypothetical protein
MAVTATPVGDDFAIIFDNSGKAVTRRFADVKVTATDADVYDVANGAAGLISLQDLILMSIQRRVTNELENVI